VYNTATVNDVTPGYYYWNGSAWVRFSTGSSSTGWLLTGNAGTVDGTNFLGTTDNIPLTLRVNNNRAGRISVGSAETFLGYNAGRVNSGTNNAFIGYFAGYNNTTGYDNTALGTAALYSLVSGSTNTAIGSQAMYYYAGTSAEGKNTAVGYKAMIGSSSSFTGIKNVGIGVYSLNNIESGSYNTAVGEEAASGITTGTYNTAVGYQTVISSSATNATAIGNGASATASNQIALGNASVTGLKIGTGSLATNASAANLYYDNTTGLVYRSTASTGSAGWLLTGNAGTTPGTNFLGTTDDNDLVFKNNNIETVRIKNDGKVAIGNFSNPEANLEVRTSSISYIYNRSYNSYAWGNESPDGSVISLEHGRGTASAPTPLQNGDWLGHIDFRGTMGTSVSGTTTASIASQSRINWDSDTRAADLRFYTINCDACGSTSSIFKNERMRIGSGGGLGININPTPSSVTNNDPQAYMQVYGGVGIGPVNTSISLTHGVENSIQIASDTYYGGSNDNHSGYLIYSTMPGGWGTAQLDICTSNDWGTYATGTPALRVTQTAIYANGTTYSSDRRLKTDIQKMPYGLNQIMKMKPLIYTKHIADSIVNGKPILGQGFKEVGFIAQDLYEVIPEVVHKPINEATEMWGIDYAKIVPILTQAIQEQQKIIEIQNEKIELQNKRLQELENKMQKFD
jgi:hypothetical protein